MRLVPCSASTLPFQTASFWASIISSWSAVTSIGPPPDASCARAPPAARDAARATRTAIFLISVLTSDIALRRRIAISAPHGLARLFDAGLDLALEHQPLAPLFHAIGRSR